MKMIESYASKEQLKALAIDHFKKLKKYLIKNNASFDKGNIHKFRIVFKKLRAYSDVLTGNISLLHSYHHSTRLQKIYHNSGTVRSLQLQQEFILSYSLSENKDLHYYYNFLNKEIRDSKNNLQKMAGAHSLKKDRKKLVSRLPERISLKEFNNTIQHKLTEIKSLALLKNPGDDIIHTIRKNLKAVIFIREFLNALSAVPSGNECFNKNEINRVRKFIKQLGAYTDLFTAIALMKKHLKKIADRQQKGLLLSVLEDWEDAKCIMKESLLRILKTDTVYNS